MTTSGAEDKAALLELAAAADTSGCARPEWMEGGGCPLDTWVDDAGHEPCGEGSWNDARLGWVGVRCDAIDGRVVSVELGETGVGGSLLPFFARLGALLIVHLNGNPALHGDVATLANATTLRRLDMRDCPLVRGEVGALATLVHLGEQFTMPDCPDLPGCPDDWEHDCSGVLWLAGSGVHGPVEALRDLPGLDDDWGPYQSGCVFSDCLCETHPGYTFSSCNDLRVVDDRRRLMETQMIDNWASQHVRSTRGVKRTSSAYHFEFGTAHGKGPPNRWVTRGKTRVFINVDRRRYNN